MALSSEPLILAPLISGLPLSTPKSSPHLFDITEVGHRRGIVARHRAPLRWLQAEYLKPSTQTEFFKPGAPVESSRLNAPQAESSNRRGQAQIFDDLQVDDAPATPYSGRPTRNIGELCPIVE